jgi:hypothetical protein
LRSLSFSESRKPDRRAAFEVDRQAGDAAGPPACTVNAADRGRSIRMRRPPSARTGLAHERSTLVQREGTSPRYFYRFSDPIFQPYVVLNGLATGMITDEQRRLVQAEPATELIPGQFEPSSPRSLF